MKCRKQAVGAIALLLLCAGCGSSPLAPAAAALQPGDVSVPPSMSITDGDAAIWTLGPGLETRRNGTQVNGVNLGGDVFACSADRLFWHAGALYVAGADDDRWWQWTGDTFVLVPATADVLRVLRSARRSDG